jgi:transposase-like protein
MTQEKAFPKTLREAVIYFSDEDRAVQFMATIRWPGGVVKCPRCGSDKVWYLKTRRLWKCHFCAEKKQISVKVGTVMEDSPISLGKWMCAFWLIANAKNGISSYELHRSIGVTQKTAWFMLHRIRLAMQDASIEKLSGRVEADETFIGGKARNVHVSKWAPRKHGRGMVRKTPVMGLLERSTPDEGSHIRLKVVKRTKKGHLQRENSRQR